MHTVKDSSRTLQFEGTLLAESTSERKDSVRWIEFKLYRTESGSYILSRIGVSLIFHGPTCELVNKYNLKDAPASELSTSATACELCYSDLETLVFPETYRLAAIYNYEIIP